VRDEGPDIARGPETMIKLPDIVPIFPLPNVVLFPDVDLPLHIFEPRYREMVTDAMDGNRLIGMTVLRGDWRREYHGSPEIYPVGCVGKIDSLSPLADGRYNLILHGVCVFSVVEEVPGKAYRRARVEWRTDESSHEEIAPKLFARLRSGVSRLIAMAGRDEPEDLWHQLPTDPGRLVNTLAFALELSALEKLALLECTDVEARTERLLEVIEFRVAEGRLGARGPSDDERRH